MSTDVRSAPMTLDAVETILSSLFLSEDDKDVNQEVIEKVKMLSIEAL